MNNAVVNSKYAASTVDTGSQVLSTAQSDVLRYKKWMTEAHRNELQISASQS